MYVFVYFSLLWHGGARNLENKLVHVYAHMPTKYEGCDLVSLDRNIIPVAVLLKYFLVQLLHFKNYLIT